MQGAREYASLFQTGQYGKLYISSHYHARGKTFRIYVLSADVKAIPNGPNGPLNKDAVEVYGVTGGQPGWTETYGWLHEGKWQQDFEKLVAEKVFEENERNALRELRKIEQEKNKEATTQQLLNNY